MADIIFVYPKTGFDVKNVSIELPLAVIHASSFLHEQGYNIKVIDQRLDSNWASTLQQELKKSPVYVGISSMTGTQIHHGLEAAKVIKQNSNAKVVWGGIHASILPEQTLKHPLIDIVVKGEGEKKALLIAESLEKNKKLKSIKGIAFKDELKKDKIISNPDDKPLDMNALPDIPYDIVNINDYLNSNGGLFSVLHSRGCPYGCAFCCNPLLSKRRWRTFSVERITKELELAHSKYKFKKLKFNDENFFVNKDRVEGIADFINNAYEWEAQARLDTVARFDYEKLRRKGLYEIQPGIESGNDRVLKLINKQLNVQKIIEYNRAISKVDLVVTYNFMMGFPTETIEELFDSLNVAIQLVKENKNAEISAFYIFVPYPGSALYDLSIKQGFVPPKTLEGWALFNRQQLYTPWIQDKKEMFQNIALTSKFIDRRRINRLFEKTRLPKFIPSLLGKLYQSRWGKKDFESHLDVKAINYAVSRMVSFN